MLKASAANLKHRSNRTCGKSPSNAGLAIDEPVAPELSKDTVFIFLSVAPFLRNAVLSAALAPGGMQQPLRSPLQHRRINNELQVAPILPILPNGAVWHSNLRCVLHHSHGHLLRKFVPQHGQE